MKTQPTPSLDHKPGTLITARGREWIVLPQENKDDKVLMVKPLGGTDAEKTGLLTALEAEDIQPYELPWPGPNTLHAFENAKLLFHATRLSFRNASGPFRCMARINFRPRPYQMVPLLMALQQEQPTRLLIADDVGVGKTVEALLVLKEWLERGEIERFAIICPPHLCDQWQRELLDKVGVEATIIRSSTLGKLERQLHGDQSVFEAFPYQVISIDYIKGDKRRGLFLQQAPEMIVVDEAHTCAKPAHEREVADTMQKQRYYLIHQLAQDTQRHLLLLTATPHSGKEEEFRSLLGLLKPELASLDIGKGQRKNREELAKYFVQRKRKDLLRWMQQDTHFAERKTQEVGITLSPAYQQVYQEMVRFILEQTQQTTHRAKKWGALTLLRGVMSSPLAGERMLSNRLQKLESSHREPTAGQATLNPYALDSDREDEPTALTIPEAQTEWLRQQIAALQQLQTPKQDYKLQRTIQQTSTWLKQQVYPIIFCKYIATAEYVGAQLSKALPGTVTVEVITSELADEQRKERIQTLGQQAQRVLVCTDCLSEGINLQEHFTAVVHYDLPWNPNRLEQREGRVDRYGQAAATVYATTIYGKDNPTEKLVLSILVNKIHSIHKDTGVQLSLGTIEQSMTDAILESLQQENTQGTQLSIFQDTITQELETAAEQAQNTRTIFAHNRVKEHIVAECLQEVDEAIGHQAHVEQFVVQAATQLGAQLLATEHGYRLSYVNLPHHLRHLFPSNVEWGQITFLSPPPAGHTYLGRNHPWVSLLCQEIMGRALDPPTPSERIGRSAVLRTDAVAQRTLLVQFRIRNLLQSNRAIRGTKAKHQLLSEEMYACGWHTPTGQAIDYAEAQQLLTHAQTRSNLSQQRQAHFYAQALQEFEHYRETLQTIAEARSAHLVQQHNRFRELVGGIRYQAVTPVLPVDILGLYLLMPI